ncbi:MAG: RNA-binding protein, partial [Clostridiales bacterium]|nr:RNA-binding protein [Clostridiales bacterium]
MIELGKYQELIVSRIKGSGFYLKEPNSDVDYEVFLPGFEVAKGTAIDDLINVFIYRDTKDELIATTKDPKILLNKLAMLKVVKVSEIGAFLDWGLGKDLFLPHSEQLSLIKEGDNILVRMYIDKSERLAATMKTQRGITSESPYSIDDTHEATIYRINPDIGIFVAVEDQYDG